MPIGCPEVREFQGDIRDGERLHAHVRRVRGRPDDVLTDRPDRDLAIRLGDGLPRRGDRDVLDAVAGDLESETGRALRAHWITRENLGCDLRPVRDVQESYPCPALFGGEGV